MEKDSPILRSPYLQWILVQIFPKLRAWPVREWPEVLSSVQAREFDQVERIGIIAAVVLVSWFLRPAATSDMTLPFAFLSQFVFSLPLLLLTAGPFFLRRIRRSLDEAARSRQDAALATPERD